MKRSLDPYVRLYSIPYAIFSSNFFSVWEISANFFSVWEISVNFLIV
jgi:hypothetical protein